MQLVANGLANAAPNWETQSDCALVSVVQTIDDGYQETPVQLRFDEAGLMLLTESNIDISKPKTGLSVDGGELIPFSRLEHDTNVLFAEDVDRLIARFIAGSQAEVRLYFWPTWPDKGQKSIKFSLLGFTQAYRAQQNCN